MYYSFIVFCICICVDFRTWNFILAGKDVGQRSVVARILQFEIKMTFLHLARILMENVSTHHQSTLSLEENLDEKKTLENQSKKALILLQMRLRYQLSKGLESNFRAESRTGFLVLRFAKKRSSILRSETKLFTCL